MATIKATSAEMRLHNDSLNLFIKQDQVEFGEEGKVKGTVYIRTDQNGNIKVVVSGNITIMVED